jgi:hypothetical protein
VDFEYSVENYRRDLYGGNLATSLFEGKLELKASGILEQDNRSHPSSFSLSSEEKDILSRAGNDRLAASKEGATFVGRGEGDYDLVYDSSGTPYYQYVGNDSGSYEVSFSWVGEKEGSYEYMGGGIYRYVYPDNGDFLPVVLLPLPESHSLFDLNLNFSPLSFLETQIEWAKSKSDKNTFSERDDHHMWGDALSVRTIYRNVDFQFLKSNFHRLELQGEYGSLTEDFAPFGRINQVERERKWGLPQKSISGDEKTYQFSGLISPWRFLVLDLDYGELKKEGSFTSQRRNLEAEVSLADWISIKGKSELIRSKEITSERLKGDDVWTRNMVALNNKYRKLSATFCWEQERRSYSDSSLATQKENFDVFSGKLNLGLSNLIKTSTQLSYRIDDIFIEDEWNKSFSYIWRNQYSMRDLQGMLSSDLEFTRRIKKNRSSSQKDSQQDLLKFSMDLYPSRQLINLKFYHSQNQIHSNQRVDTYLEVDPGNGNYCYEDGEYVSHPEGNFIRISEWVGDTQPSLDLNKSIRLIFSPHKVSSRDEGRSFWLQVGRIFSTDSFVNLRGRFKDQKALSFYFIYPLTSLSDEDILSQNVTIRHDLYLLPTYEPLHLRLRWEKSRDEDNLLSDGGLRETKIKGELLLRCYASSKHSFESRIGKEKIRSNRENDLKSLVEGRSLAFAFTRRQTQALEVKISAKYKKKDDQIQSQVAEFFSLSPEILWSLLSQGRLKAFFEWTHLRSTPDSRSLSYVLGESKDRGENYGWRLFFDYKLNRYLTTSLVYSGESVPDKETKHTGRMEMKAYF